MQDMIERIVEMDKAAREMTQKVKKEKLGLEQEIHGMKQSIREEYLERARKRIEINKGTEQKNANEKMKIIKENELKIEKNLNESYAKNGDMWVDTIVQRALEG